MKLSRRLSALSLLGLAVALSPNGASAADKDTLPRKVGDWTLAISEDGDGCFLTRIYDPSRSSPSSSVVSPGRS